jgi:LysM repeat protein
MLFKAKFTFFLVFLSIIPLQAKRNFISLNDYVAKYKDIAIMEMERTGIPASIKLGQGIMESVHGNSTLARNSNNHFGIKCKSEWTGKKYYHKDDDLNNVGELIESCFRVYPTVFDSYIDHSNFLMSRDRYAILFTYSNTDYVSWANGLKSAGYATAPYYATKLIEIIETNQLQQYDSKNSNISILNNGDWRSIRPTNYNQYYTINLTNAPLLKQRRPLIVPQTNNPPSSSLSDLIYGVSHFKSQKDEKFVINGLNAVALRDRETIETIALKYKIKASTLLKYNDLSPNQPLLRKQYIFLEKKKKTNETMNYHKAEKGETLYIIAQKHGIQLQKLQLLNPKLTNPVLMAGTLVKLNNKDMVPIQQSK